MGKRGGKLMGKQSGKQRSIRKIDDKVIAEQKG